MLKTKDARNKICPFMSSQQQVYIGFMNGWATEIKEEKTVELHQKCITKDCMAWVTNVTHEQIENKVTPADNKEACMNKFIDGKELAEDDKKGFCVRLRR